MLNSARMRLLGQVQMTGMLLNPVHPSFSNTANTSCSIRASFFKIPIFKLPYQNARIIMGNSLFLATLFLIHVLCYTQKTASVEDVLYAFGQMSVLVLEVVSAQWPVPGRGSRRSRVVPCAGGTVPSHTGRILAWQIARKCCRLWGIPGHV